MLPTDVSHARYLVEFLGALEQQGCFVTIVNVRRGQTIYACAVPNTQAHVVVLVSPLLFFVGVTRTAIDDEFDYWHDSIGWQDAGFGPTDTLKRVTPTFVKKIQVWAKKTAMK